MSRANHTRGDGTPKKGAKKGAEEAERIARDAEALRLRRQEKTWVQIGEELGVDKSTACRAYSRARARLLEMSDEDAAAIRDEQAGAIFESLERQEEVIQRLCSRVGDDIDLDRIEQLRKSEATYVQTWEKLGELWGTKAPTKVKVYGDLEEKAFAKLMEAGDFEGLRRVAEEGASPLEVLMSRRGAVPKEGEGG
jgi:hypothetical protein